MLGAASAGYVVAPQEVEDLSVLFLRVGKVLWGPGADELTIALDDVAGLPMEMRDEVRNGGPLLLLLDRRGQPGWLAIPPRHVTGPGETHHLLAIGAHPLPDPYIVPREVIVRAGQEGVFEYPVIGMLRMPGDTGVELHLDLMEVSGEPATVPYHVHGLDGWEGLAERAAITVEESPLRAAGHAQVTLDLGGPDRPLVLRGTLSVERPGEQAYGLTLNVRSPLLPDADTLKQYVSDASTRPAPVIVDLVEEDGTTWVLHFDGAAPSELTLTRADGEVLTGGTSRTTSSFQMTNGVSSTTVTYEFLFGEGERAIAIQLRLTGEAAEQAETSTDALFGSSVGAGGAAVSVMRGVELGEVGCAIGQPAPQPEPSKADFFNRQDEPWGRACGVTVRAWELGP